jgi:hypothetical protein
VSRGYEAALSVHEQGDFSPGSAALQPGSGSSPWKRIRGGRRHRHGRSRGEPERDRQHALRYDRSVPCSGLSSADGNVVTSVELYWLPLGAGEPLGVVRRSGRVFEALQAWRQRRDVCDLYHSALRVRLGNDAFVIEMAPVWGNAAADRGVVSGGPVGSRRLGCSRYFRYEVRCWRDGTIPDQECAVASPVSIDSDDRRARWLVDLVPAFPAVTWGRDELGAGEMWNSNSLTAWLLARSGHDVGRIAVPRHGRAPGWTAGLIIASRSSCQVSVD